MILLDTSGLFAAPVGNQRAHEAAKAALEHDGGPFVLSPFVLAELDYVLGREAGVDAQLAVLREVEAGAYELASFLDGDVAAAIGVVERYRDLGVGLADASIVVLAGRLGAERVLSLDERHFRAMTMPDGRAFVLLPADASTMVERCSTRPPVVRDCGRPLRPRGAQGAADGTASGTG